MSTAWSSWTAARARAVSNPLNPRVRRVYGTMEGLASV